MGYKIGDIIKINNVDYVACEYTGNCKGCSFYDDKYNDRRACGFTGACIGIMWVKV